MYTLHLGDSLTVLPTVPSNSIDAIVCDPPYELGFMGLQFDKTGIAYNVQLWKEALRVLKPGGHLLAFSGSRTYHRMTCAIEDAGFEVRDQILWVYGSGFPKSLDVSKAIDKSNGKHDVDLKPFGDYVKECRLIKDLTLGQLDALMDTCTAASWWEGRKSGVQLPSPEMYAKLKIALGMDSRFDALINWAEAEREITGKHPNPASEIFKSGPMTKDVNTTAPATQAAKQWQGWGTALKPSHEPICVARKPLAKGLTVAANVLAHGTGALNIDGCRVPGEPWKAHQATGLGSVKFFTDGENPIIDKVPNDLGRWPANLILSYPEDEYRIREDVTPQQLRELAEWLHANP